MPDRQFNGSVERRFAKGVYELLRIDRPISWLIRSPDTIAKPIKNVRLRRRLAIFFAKTRMGWTVANCHQQVRGSIDVEHAAKPRC
jgi:hypothetical protein